MRPKGNLAGLDVLRACAILMVFLMHAASGSRLKGLFTYGWSGVDLFFVLSGVLIGTQLWKELQRTGNIRVGRFLLRRGLRIWPLYAAVVMAMGAEVLFLGRDGSGLWADATYLSNYFHCQIGGSWSLSTEEQFYIIAPVSLVLLKKVLKLNWMWVGPVGVLVAFSAIRAAIVHGSHLPEPELRQWMYLKIHTHSDGLAVGILLAWLAVVHPSWIKRAQIRWPAAVAMLGVGLLIYRVSPIVTNFGALALIYGAATLVGMGATRIPSVFNWQGFYVISRLSYGMYLNQFGLLEHMEPRQAAWHAKWGELGYWACAALSLAFSVALAALTFMLIERPFLLLRDRYMAEHSPQATVVASRATVASVS